MAATTLCQLVPGPTLGSSKVENLPQPLPQTGCAKGTTLSHTSTPRQRWTRSYKEMALLGS